MNYDFLNEIESESKAKLDTTCCCGFFEKDCFHKKSGKCPDDI